MLNIVVFNCDDTCVEYEWNSVEDFVQSMNSDEESIPMLDDALLTLDTDSENLELWWRLSDGNGMTVNDLYEECKMEMCL